MKSRVINKEVKVVCNGCGAEFIMNPQKKKFPDGIEISYFVCSECGEKYVYLVTNAELRKQIKSRGFRGSAADMKLWADELKKKYADRIKEFEHESKI